MKPTKEQIKQLTEESRRTGYSVTELIQIRIDAARDVAADRQNYREMDIVEREAYWG